MQSIPVSARPQRTLRLFTLFTPSFKGSLDGCVIFSGFANIDTAPSAA